MIDVTVWCEFIQEREDAEVAAVYPHGIHEAIAQGLRRESDLAVTTASLEHEELYGERFDIPAPDELIFISWFEGGEVFRSGVTYRRGNGRIFYFQPGHETYPIYYQPEIVRVLVNAVRWAAPLRIIPGVAGIRAEPPEPMPRSG